MKIIPLADGVTVIDGASEIKPLIDARLFDAEGTLRPMPSEWWQSKTREEKMVFGHANALYSFPTHESIAILREWIGDREALEIGAGNGAYCKALGIRGTDNKMQRWPEIQAIYAAHGQPSIRYGAHVEEIGGNDAVVQYRPQVVLAAWVTHKFVPTRPECKGNMYGVSEHAILSSVDEYIFIGNTNTHQLKPMFQDLNAGLIPSHYIEDFQVGLPCLHSRASGGLDFMLRIKRK